MSDFNIGDIVEVLPAPEEAGFTWRMVGLRRGTVNCIDTSRSCSRTVGVLFRDGSVYWCDPAWLRRVESHEIASRVRDVRVSRETFLKMLRAGQDDILEAIRAVQDSGKSPGVILLPGECYFGLHLRLEGQVPSHDAPSRPQDARSAPEQAKPDSQGRKPRRAEPVAWLDAEEVARLMGEEPPEKDAPQEAPERVRDARCDSCDSPGSPGSPDAVAYPLYRVCYRCFDRCSGPGPCYQKGDVVWYRGNERDRTVTAVSVMPRYRLDGGETWVREDDLTLAFEQLRPHVPKPAKCAPDGTRCEEWQNSGSRHRMEAQEFRFCPFCGGKLTAGG